MWASSRFCWMKTASNGNYLSQNRRTSGGFGCLMALLLSGRRQQALPPVLQGSGITREWIDKTHNIITGPLWDSHLTTGRLYGLYHVFSSSFFSLLPALYELTEVRLLFSQSKSKSKDNIDTITEMSQRGKKTEKRKRSENKSRSASIEKEEQNEKDESCCLRV